MLNGEIVYVSDFGLARAAGEGHALESTVAYQAPEVQADPSAASVASDIYAFGLILRELLGDEDGFGLAELARRCLDTDPGRRPPSFAAVYLSILERAGGFIRELMTVTAMLDLQMSVAITDLAHARVRTLLALGEHGLAREEIAALPPEQVTAEILTMKGHALALTGRDEEAIATFDQVLAQDPPAAVRLDCLSGQGLSLKRLGRHAESQQVLTRVIVEQTPAGRPTALMNLATVHLDAAEYDQAAGLLTRAGAEMPGWWQIWANLGIAHEGQGAYEEAATAYQRAVRAAPYEGLPLLKLAAVCMDHLGRLDVASTALAQLADQDLITREWAVRQMALYLLDGRDEEAAALGATELLAGARALAERICRHEPPPARANGPGPAPSLDDLPAGWQTVPYSPCDVSPLSGDPETAAAYAIPRDELFLGLRVYVRQRFYCFDFFGPPDHPGYAADLLQRLDGVRAVIEINLPSHRLREVPPYFHRCPHCDAYVLTNRPSGTDLRCRCCARPAPTEPVRDPRLDELADEVARRLGRTRADISGHEQVLLAEIAEDRQPVARELAAALGFEPLGLGHPYALRLRVAVGRDRAPGFGKEDLMAFHKIAEPGTFAYAEGNTPDGEALLFLLRAVAGVARSVSLAFDPLAADAVTMHFAGRDEEFLADMEARAVARPHDADLHRLVARLRLNAGRTAEAAEDARTAVTRWPEDADSWSLSAAARMATGAYAEAIRDLRRSLRIDPVQPYVLGLLARCHDELGEAEQAAEARARGLSLGG